MPTLTIAKVSARPGALQCWMRMIHTQKCAENAIVLHATRLGAETGTVRTSMDSGSERRVRSDAVSHWGSAAAVSLRRLIAPDGERFLLTVPMEGARATPISVRVNWPVLAGSK